MLAGCLQGVPKKIEQTCGSTGETSSLAAAVAKLFVQARAMAVRKGLPSSRRAGRRGPPAAGPRAGGPPYPAPYPAVGARAGPPLSNTAPFSSSRQEALGVSRVQALLHQGNTHRAGVALAALRRS